MNKQEKNILNSQLKKDFTRLANEYDYLIDHYSNEKAYAKDSEIFLTDERIYQLCTLYGRNFSEFQDKIVDESVYFRLLIHLKFMLTSLSEIDKFFHIEYIKKNLTFTYDNQIYGTVIITESMNHHYSVFTLNTKKQFDMVEIMTKFATHPASPASLLCHMEAQLLSRPYPQMAIIECIRMHKNYSVAKAILEEVKNA